MYGRLVNQGIRSKGVLPKKKPLRTQTVKEDFAEEVDMELDPQSVSGQKIWIGSQEKGMV